MRPRKISFSFQHYYYYSFWLRFLICYQRISKKLDGKYKFILSFLWQLLFITLIILISVNYYWSLVVIAAQKHLKCTCILRSFCASQPVNVAQASHPTGGTNQEADLPTHPSLDSTEGSGSQLLEVQHYESLSIDHQFPIIPLSTDLHIKFRSRFFKRQGLPCDLALAVYVKHGDSPK